MGRMPPAVYLWPGLPQLWRRGTWSALACAVAFAALLNGAVLVSFLWTELVPPVARNLAWLAVGVIWVGAGAFSWLWDSQQAACPEAAAGRRADAFAEALDHYLKGNWFEAESVLGELLRRSPRDIEAGLMMASLLRHTGRFDEAAGHLDRIERFEGGQTWGLEIRRERQYLNEARQLQTTEPAGSPNGE